MFSYGVVEYVYLCLFPCIVEAVKSPRHWVKWAKFTGAENPGA